jgi:hypothetical protein
MRLLDGPRMISKLLYTFGWNLWTHKSCRPAIFRLYHSEGCDIYGRGLLWVLYQWLVYYTCSGVLGHHKVPTSVTLKNRGAPSRCCRWPHHESPRSWEWEHRTIVGDVTGYVVSPSRVVTTICPNGGSVGLVDVCYAWRLWVLCPACPQLSLARKSVLVGQPPLGWLQECEYFR